jgi:hypothetical protein
LCQIPVGKRSRVSNAWINTYLYWNSRECSRYRRFFY